MPRVSPPEPNKTVPMDNILTTIKFLPNVRSTENTIRRRIPNYSILAVAMQSNLCQVIPNCHMSPGVNCRPSPGGVGYDTCHLRVHVKSSIINKSVTKFLHKWPRGCQLSYHRNVPSPFPILWLSICLAKLLSLSNFFQYQEHVEGGLTTQKLFPFNM